MKEKVKARINKAIEYCEELLEKELEEFGTCTSCKKLSSYLGKMYWFNGKLYCKDCLIQELLKEKVIYDNWYTNF